MTPALEVVDLHAGYRAVQVLHGIDVTLESGTITAVLGSNGAGKTTLLRTLSGLLPPTRGSVRYDGRDLVTVPVEERVKLGIAHVPEGRGVITALTVGGVATPTGSIYATDDESAALTEYTEEQPEAPANGLPE